MKINEDKIKEILERGTAEVIERGHLEQALRSGRKLKVKFGIDPTAPDLHLGHVVPLRKLRQFQDAGHEAILIIGDFTAQIGDPSGKDTARKPLTEKDVNNNLKKYLKLAGKIIDIKKTKAFRKYHNSKWLKNTTTILNLARIGSIQQSMRREDFRARISKEEDVTLLEAMYPLFQGYDSVAVKADVEIGGIDQKLNLLAGRRLQKHYGMPEQDIIMTPLLIGIDGNKKMSKSAGNYISLDEKPFEMFAKVMAIPDGQMKSFFETLTDEEYPGTEDNNIPFNIKKFLSYTLVKVHHGDDEAKKARENFEKTFTRKETPGDLRIYRVHAGEGWVEFLINEQFVLSRTEAKRLLYDGAIEMDGIKVSSQTKRIEKSGTARIGKHKFIRIEIIK